MNKLKKSLGSINEIFILDNEARQTSKPVKCSVQQKKAEWL